MTEQPDDVSTAVDTSEPPSSDAPDDDIAGDDEQVVDMRGVRRLRAEAKKLRHQLRESEANRASENAKHAADRESDLARLAALEKAEIERAASAVLVDAEDLWRYVDEATQQTFNDEFGAIVADNVVEAAKKLAADRPHLAKPVVAPPPSAQPIEGLRPGASPESKPKPTSWAAAIHGRSS